MPLFLIDLEQCPSFYRADLRMAIEEEVRKAVRIRNAIEEHNETKIRQDEYQDVLNYISFLNKILNKIKELENYNE